MVTKIEKTDLPRDALYEKVNQIASELDNNSLHRNGSEEKIGCLTAKAASFPFIAQSPDLDKDVAPTSNKYIGYDFRDKNNKRLAWIGVTQDTNNNINLGIQLLTGGVVYDLSGKNTSIASSSTTDSAFAPKGWVSDPNKALNVVHRNGNEEITGLKTHINQPFAYKSTLGWDAKPSSGVEYHILKKITDKNNTTVGEDYLGKFNNGKVQRLIRCYQNTGSLKGAYGGLILDIDEDGGTTLRYDLRGSSPSAYANIPDSGVSIPTMDKVNSRITALMNSKVITESGDGYVKFGNGLLVQWGLNNVMSGSRVTLPNPYTKSYTVQVSKRSFDAISQPKGARPVIGANVDNLSSFLCYNVWTTTNDQYNISIYWLAIGY